MNAVAAHAAHGGQLTIRCTEALILAIRKHEELVTRSYLSRLAFMDGEGSGPVRYSPEDPPAHGA